MTDRPENDPLVPDFATDLTEFTVQLNQKIANANFSGIESLSRFGFNIGSINLALKKNQRAEIITMPDICVIPNTPGFFRGMINLRGNIIPVFDFEYFLNTNAPETGQYLLILENNGQYCALTVSEMPVLINIESESQELPENCPDILKNNLNKVYRFNNLLWIEPNYENLLDDIKNYF